MKHFVPDLIQDLKYALRTARRSPGFLAVVVLSVGIGVAANTTIFTIANAVLFGALPVHEPDRVVNLDNSRDGSSFSYPNYEDLRKCEAFDDIAAHFPIAPVSFNTTGTPERVWGALVTGNYFSVLAVPMTHGRGIQPAEDDHRDAVIVLSDALWKRRFGADPSIVGHTVTMNNRSWQVVGVAAPGFHGSDRMLVAEFWAPLSMHPILLPEISRNEPVSLRENQWLLLDGRLKPGVSLTQATAALNVINARLDDLYSKNQPKSKMILELAGKLPGDMNSSAVGFFAGLMIVVGLVLVIACANVANLLLAKASARQREIAMRLAVGANRGRLIRQFLTESVVLSMFGAIAGFALSYFATAAIARVPLPVPIPVDIRFAPDLRVLAYTAALAIFTGLLFGIAPALKATRADLNTAMKERRFGLRNILVVTQVTFSLVLLISAGLFLRSLGSAASIDLGLRGDPVLSVAFDPNQHSASKEKIGQLLDNVRDRVAALPGIASVSYVDFVPLTIVGSQTRFKNGDAEAMSTVFQVGARYFETMGIPIVAGRDFAREGKAPVAIVNRALAEKLFPGQSPLGRELRNQRTSYQIVGVVANSKQRTLGEGDHPAAYLPLDQNLDKIMSITGIALVAKAANPRESLEAVQREIHLLQPNLATFNALTMREQIQKAMLVPRLMAALFGIFGVAGLALAVVGLYGVMSFSVGRRTKEIGIRMALGAGRSEILAMVTRQGLTLTAIGLVLGLAIAFAASKAAESFLYGVSPRDLLTFIAVPAILATVAFVASFIPARRAAKLHPLSALRYE
jgi:predicted permease